MCYLKFNRAHAFAFCFVLGVFVCLLALVLNLTILIKQEFNVAPGKFTIPTGCPQEMWSSL